MIAHIIEVKEEVHGSGDLVIIVAYREDTTTIETKSFSVNLGLKWNQEERQRFRETVLDHGRWIQHRINRLSVIKSELEGQSVPITQA